MIGEALRLILLLLEELHDAGTAVELRLGGGVEVGTELGEGGEFAELGEVELGGAGDLLDGLGLAAEPTRDTERPTEMAGRMPW